MPETSIPSRKIAIIRLSILIGSVVALLVAGIIIGPDRLSEVFDSLSGSVWGAVLFIVLYAAFTMLMAPGTVSSLAGGAIFGFALGFGLVMVGATLGAVGAFMISRKAGRESMKTLLGDKTNALDGWIDDNGLTTIVVLRLLPIVPFNVLNYAAGLSVLNLRRYTVGTALGIIPGVAVLTSLGASASDPGGAGFILSLVALALLVVVSGILAKRMQRRRGEGPESSRA